ncbi:STY0301 family protein [Azospirillum sp. sgz302134]
MRSLAIILATLLAAGSAVASEVRCPPSLTVQAQPEAPGGWSPYPAKDSHVFSTMSLVEGDRAKEMASPAPATLAPERSLRRGRSETQMWDFIGPRRENVFVICSYAGTQATIALDLPREVRRCQFTFEIDQRGAFVENPRNPPQLVCR